MDTKLKSTFWQDRDIENVPPEVKLAAIWLMSNSSTNALGMSTASERRFAFETGLPPEALQRACDALPRAFKKFGDLVWVVKYVEHQLGRGKTLTANRIFNSLRSTLKGINDRKIIAAFVEFYPEFESVISHDEPIPMSSPCHGVREGEGEGEASEGGAGETAATPPAPTELDHCREILAHLNAATKRDFRPVPTNLDPIRCRLREVKGDVDGVKRMIDRQCARWLADPKMAEYLRVQTLFGATKFHDYFSSRELPVAQPQAPPAPAVRPPSAFEIEKRLKAINDELEILNDRTATFSGGVRTYSKYRDGNGVLLPEHRERRLQLQAQRMRLTEQMTGVSLPQT